MFKIAIIGKPNVGKSTLFNKLCNKRIAIVGDKPGITRDYKEHIGELLDLTFSVFDTAGWESDLNDFKNRILDRSNDIISTADVLFFIVDGSEDLSAEDIDFANIIRKLNKDVILIVNKSDKHNITNADLYGLGFNEPVYISAANKLGFDTLYYRLREKINQFSKPITDDKIIFETDNRTLRAKSRSVLKGFEHENQSALERKLQKRSSSEESIVISIVGRPNVGKSTLFNRILGYERTITDFKAGTTRDSIVALTNINGDSVSIIDTAGIRKKKRINYEDNIEFNAIGQSIAAIKRAHVALIVLDAERLLEKQDITIARVAINEGKSIVIVINKCDLFARNWSILQKQVVADLMHHGLNGFNVLCISADTGQNIDKLYNLIKLSWNNWHKKIKTSELNNWLKNITINNKAGIKYITQTAIKPPTFVAFSNHVVSESHLKYLKKSLKNYFDLNGAVIRFTVKEK